MYRIVLLAVVMTLTGCTNVNQMYKLYQEGDEGQLDRIMEIVSRPDYPYATRRKAAQILGEIGDVRAVPDLVELMLDKAMEQGASLELVHSDAGREALCHTRDLPAGREGMIRGAHEVAEDRFPERPLGPLEEMRRVKGRDQGRAGARSSQDARGNRSDVLRVEDVGVACLREISRRRAE